MTGVGGSFPVTHTKKDSTNLLFSGQLDRIVSTGMGHTKNLESTLSQGGYFKQKKTGFTGSDWNGSGEAFLVSHDDFGPHGFFTLQKVSQLFSMQFTQQVARQGVGHTQHAGLARRSIQGAPGWGGDPS